MVGSWNLKNGQLIWKTSIDNDGQVSKLLALDAQRLLCMTSKGMFVLLEMKLWQFM